MAEDIRHVAMSAVAVERAEEYANTLKKTTGETIPIKSVFAKALDVMLNTEKTANGEQ